MENLDRFILLIQEYAHNGSLQLDLDKKFKYTDLQAIICVKQILNALLFMHRNHILYRDLKSENILLSFGIIKITDFGCSVYNYQQQRRTFCGTVDYMSPEIAQGQYYGQSVDMWSLGVLTYYILTGIQPFQQSTKNDTLQCIINKQNISFPSYVSCLAQDFIQKLLVKDPEFRMNIEEAVNHEWINQNINYYIQENWSMDITQQTMQLVK
ncbi:serine threonine protein kinase, putative [Ichthyophthirius multifiliis]|uniref:Serine threonine protein kinase, putative n=1 Tax=Ichthyophthirius multifiliis TaxID=5932 RepID=G0QLU2_ICHMU|nr:serine threonine protein kinase, putative [Ichthyophthirius multifiliis]EGR33810.1 serine threonine protein kinase, putative [Ichthyophthirius multifiliis]|eukprot:XP_004039034.1 serine threonine protein kinase, putative [Ichthyophthirius multifiliis]